MVNDRRVPESATHVWNLFAKGRRQIDLMVLLLHEDLTNLLGYRVFPKRFTLNREGGILKRLRATPLRPRTILAAHVIVKLLSTAVTRR